VTVAVRFADGVAEIALAALAGAVFARGAVFAGVADPPPSSFLKLSEADGLSMIASAIAISAARVFAFAGSA
jgi:hypothetical protein